MRARNVIAVVIMLLLAVLLQGCGRKGPLYLQAKPVAPAAAVQPVLQMPPAQSAVVAPPTVPNPTDTTK